MICRTSLLIFGLILASSYANEGDEGGNAKNEARLLVGKQVSFLKNGFQNLEFE